MNWSDEQSNALKDIERWFKSDTKKRQVYRLFGYAGTGKTTIAEYLQTLAPDKVGYAAFTGKAASVLASKGCTGARTIHSLIYKRMEDPVTHKVDWVLRSYENAAKNRIANADISELYGMKLLVVDEVSMVGDDIGRDLISFGVPILVLGDPFQLPPVDAGGFFINEKPDTTLNEIHRQARDNPIIRMASKVRLEFDNLSIGDYGDGNRVIRTTEFEYDMVFNTDQLLCGTNKNRQKFNRKARVLLDVEDDIPLCNDKLICLENNRSKGLMNGTIWWVDQVISVEDALNKFQLVTAGDDVFLMKLRSTPEEDSGDVVDVRCIPAMFAFKNFKDKKAMAELRTMSRGCDNFDYAYAITVHKSQGSQWDDVMIYDDCWDDRNVENFRYRWLYTAITRAAKTVTVIGNR